MKDYYTIGETAKLLGVSAQALRYYDRENILRPEYINEQTGYRYYTYRQFHIIDRIKYFQSFGLSLEEIGEIIRQGTAEHLLTRLTARKEVLLEQINREYGTTILLVTHNTAIRRMAHQVLTIRDGRVTEETYNDTPVPAAELEDL